MFENYNVITLASRPRNAMRVFGIFSAMIPAGVMGLGLWLMVFDGSVTYRRHLLEGPVWGSVLILAGIGAGMAMRSELGLAFKDPTLVSGTDVTGGILLTQRSGPSRGATVFLPDRTEVVLTAVPTRPTFGTALYGLRVSTVQGSTLLDLRMKPRAWDLSSAQEHLARHEIHVSIGQPQPLPDR